MLPIGYAPSAMACMICVRTCSGGLTRAIVVKSVLPPLFPGAISVCLRVGPLGRRCRCADDRVTVTEGSPTSDIYNNGNWPDV